MHVHLRSEGLQGAEDLLSLGGRQPAPQSQLGWSLQRRVKGKRDLRGRGSLLLTLLLRYGLGNQPGLTCEHVAVQVERRQVTAWKRS